MDYEEKIENLMSSWEDAFASYSAAVDDEVEHAETTRVIEEDVKALEVWITYKASAVPGTVDAKKTYAQFLLHASKGYTDGDPEITEMVASYQARKEDLAAEAQVLAVIRANSEKARRHLYGIEAALFALGGVAGFQAARIRHGR